MMSSEGIGGNTFSKNISKAMPKTPVDCTIASTQDATAFPFSAPRRAIRCSF
jgi:hypothetical protein